MELIVRPSTEARRRVVIFPSAFNPPTIAHEALIRAAAGRANTVVLALARELPHKQYSDVPFPARLEMALGLANKAQAAVAVTSGGLFTDIAREAREHFQDAQISILCGRDAAERAIRWDYGKGASIETQLREFSLMVAARGGEFELPAGMAHLEARVERLAMDFDCSHVSGTEIRRRIAAGEPWKDLVPESIVDLVENFYS